MPLRCSAPTPAVPGRREPDQRCTPRQREAGFTLIELLVVLAILGLLISVVAPQVIRYLGRAKVDAANYQTKNIETALDLFMIDEGRYPTEQEGLRALFTNPGIPKWEGPYLKGSSGLVDPWGHPYQYHIPGTEGRAYDIFSLGPDSNGTAASNQ
jgi:general secretion pathway protein G